MLYKSEKKYVPPPYGRYKSNKFLKGYLLNDKDTKNEFQVIIYPNGKVAVGYDVWRLLNRKDFCSYPIEYFKTIESAEKKYFICLPQKKWYMEANGSIRPAKLRNYQGGEKYVHRTRNFCKKEGWHPSEMGFGKDRKCN